jgi:hypothetical protein
MQDEAAARFHRTAELDGKVTGSIADAAARGGSIAFLAAEIEIFEQLLELKRLRPVDNEPHGAILGMGAHEYDGALEALIAHTRHGYEEMPIQASPGPPGQFLFDPEHGSSLASFSILESPFRHMIG